MEEEELSNEIIAEQGDTDSLGQLIAIVLAVYTQAKSILLSNRLLFIIILIFGMGITAWKVLNVRSVYSAKVLFMLQEEESGTPGVMSLADPLSSYLLSRSTTQSLTIDKLREIALSQMVLANVFFSKGIIRGKEDYLINHFLIINEDYDESYFKVYRGLTGLNRSQYKAFSLVLYVFKTTMVEIDQNKSGAFYITVKTKDEELSKILCEIYYQNLSNFYIDKTTEKAQRNYIFLRNRLDSVRNMLYATEYQVANFEDRANNLLLNTARVPQRRQFRNTEFYQELYGENLKSFEASKVTLNNIMPIFQLLNRPYYPLPVERTSRLLTLIVGLVVTIFIVILVIAGIYIFNIIRNKIKDTQADMANEEDKVAEQPLT